MCPVPQKNGRLQDITGIYMPARGDNKQWLDVVGWSLALLTLVGVILHGAGRYYTSRRKG